MNVFARLGVVCCLAVGAAACAADGGTGNPIVRPFQYFSYANGDDIRALCEPGGTSRYRIIYNALYEEQVRTYDIVQAFGAGEGIQETRVFRRGLGGQVDIYSDGVDFRSNFHSRVPLDLDDLVAIDRALIEAGFEAPTRNGLKLHSDEFYWIAMVCRDGVFKYQAWTKRTTDLADLPFVEVLSPHDETGVKVAPPVEPVFQHRGARPTNSRDMSSSSYFSMEVGDNGLKL
ncbi:hypothetical protein [Sneathiella chinensis]|uniref:Lipoprotein n=1 Tax=Sneathiella chinensis TaxID=349750 RepID=A0ABQ5U8P2_9PROT|nr:hypothetical protein [Sneathiella chinensis]GLQ07692.1 hypothetical protein GCM10007924_29130 [Sneathiella chinensis]